VANKEIQVKNAETPTVSPTATPTGNTATVYYTNSNFSSAYIHYKAGNGDWTTVPGVKMSASDRSDYTWMYTIDLGTSDNATVCFNNGSGNWDSRNGTNYTVKAGIYGVSNGQVYDLSQVITTPPVTPTITPTQDTDVYFDNTNAKWSNVYAYVWTDGVTAKVLDTTKSCR